MLMKRSKKIINGTSELKVNMAKARQWQLRWCACMKNVRVDSGGLWWYHEYRMFRDCFGDKYMEGKCSKGPKSSQVKSHVKHMRQLHFCNRLVQIHFIFCMLFEFKIWLFLISWGCQMKYNLVDWMFEMF